LHGLKKGNNVDLRNQVVMITGSTGNLGSAVVQAFYRAGANLALIDHSSDRLPQTFPELMDEEKVLFLPSIDVTDDEKVAGAVAEAIDHFGKIDILINTVGGYLSEGQLHETSLKAWRYMFDLNATSVFVMCRRVIPHMVQQESGRIVSIAAGPGLEGRAKMSAYAASKGAVIRLTETMAAELKGSGIRVNCFVPTIIDSPENREDFPKANHEKWLKPESLADAILYLVSDEGNAIHAAAIPVTGSG
jgi:NAD(P)-dependent dehydrogenase (short-subunit alcohol dehydrogenase family)